MEVEAPRNAELSHQHSSDVNPKSGRLPNFRHQTALDGRAASGCRRSQATLASGSLSPGPGSAWHRRPTRRRRPQDSARQGTRARTIQRRELSLLQESRMHQSTIPARTTTRNGCCRARVIRPRLPARGCDHQKGVAGLTNQRVRHDRGTVDHAITEPAIESHGIAVVFKGHQTDPVITTL